jgi:hypothetical protein
MRDMGWSQRARRVIAVVLVVVFGISFLAAGLGIWLHRNTLNEDVWRDRVASLGDEPEVQAALSAYTTEQITTTLDAEGFLRERLPEPAGLLAVPLSSAIDGFVAERVDRFYASDRFEDLWEQAAIRAQREVVLLLRNERRTVESDPEKVSIDLIPLIEAALREVVSSVPELIGIDVELPERPEGELPAETRQRLADTLGIQLDDDFGRVVIYDKGRLASAQQIVALFDQVVVGSIVLAIFTGGGALLVSPRRRRTGLQLLGAVAVACLLVRRAAFILQDQVLELFEVDVNRAAGEVVLSTIIDPLTTAAGSTLWAVGFLALVLALTGPYGWAVELRGQARGAAGSLGGAASDAAQSPQLATFVQRHADRLRIAGYAGAAAVLLFGDLGFLGVLLLAVALVGWQVAVSRLAGPSHEGAAEGEGAGAVAQPDAPAELANEQAGPPPTSVS